jgi:hypothetical protein
MGAIRELPKVRDIENFQVIVVVRRLIRSKPVYRPTHFGDIGMQRPWIHDIVINSRKIIRGSKDCLLIRKP